MHLHLLDWIIVLLTIAVCFIPALFVAKRSGKDTSEFFASGRAVPWWLAGVSMVATTFASDTPNLVTNFRPHARSCRELAVVGLHAHRDSHSLLLCSSLAALRRADGLEFYELRYSGKAAMVVRGFRSLYLGFFFNCIIMATVNLAACKIAAIMFGFSRWKRSSPSASSTSSSPPIQAFGECWSST